MNCSDNNISKYDFKMQFYLIMKVYRLFDINWMVGNKKNRFAIGEKLCSEVIGTLKKTKQSDRTKIPNKKYVGD